MSNKIQAVPELFCTTIASWRRRSEHVSCWPVAMYLYIEDAFVISYSGTPGPELGQIESKTPWKEHPRLIQLFFLFIYRNNYRFNLMKSNRTFSFVSPYLNSFTVFFCQFNDSTSKLSLHSKNDEKRSLFTVPFIAVDWFIKRICAFSIGLNEWCRRWYRVSTQLWIGFSHQFRLKIALKHH